MRQRRARAAQRLDHVRPQHDGVVVALVERHPCHRPALRLALAPRRQQRRLAEPGRARDEAEATAAALAQPLEQPLARDRLGRDGRRVQLREQQDGSVLTCRQLLHDPTLRILRAPFESCLLAPTPQRRDRHGEAWVGELLRRRGRAFGGEQQRPDRRVGREGGAAVPLQPHGPEGHRQAARRAEPHEARCADGRGRRRDVGDPVRLHLPRPVHRPRPDVRQDERHARHADQPERAAAGPLAQPRPRLALRRRPAGPGVGEVLRGRRHAPEDGQDRGGRRHPRQERLRPPARRRLEPEGQAQGDHPRPAQRREPRGRPDTTWRWRASTTACSTRCRPRCRPRRGSRPRASSSPSTTSG